MKEMERSNRVAMIAHGVINACMLFISVIGFVEHTVSAPVLAVLMLLGIIPVLAEFICWKRDHATNFDNEMAYVMSDGKWGIIDPDGKGNSPAPIRKSKGVGKRTSNPERHF